jgi:hypothetical protein
MLSLRHLPKEATMASDDKLKREQESKDEDADKAAHEEMDRLAEADELPSDPRDWPTGKAKFLTLGGSDDPDRYGEGATEKLGPAEVVHEADGSISVAGEQVDNPEDYKAESILSDSPAIPGEGKPKEEKGESAPAADKP